MNHSEAVQERHEQIINESKGIAELHEMESIAAVNHACANKQSESERRIAEILPDHSEAVFERQAELESQAQVHSARTLADMDVAQERASLNKESESQRRLSGFTGNPHEAAVQANVEKIHEEEAAANEECMRNLESKLAQANAKKADLLKRKSIETAGKSHEEAVHARQQAIMEAEEQRLEEERKKIQADLERAQANQASFLAKRQSKAKAS